MEVKTSQGAKQNFMVFCFLSAPAKTNPDNKDV